MGALSSRTGPRHRLMVLGRWGLCLALGPALLLVGGLLRIEPCGAASGSPYVPGAARGARYSWNAREHSLRPDVPQAQGERTIWHSFSLSRDGLHARSTYAWYERHEHELEWFDPSAGVFTALSDEERKQIAPQLALILKRGMGSPFRVDMLARGIADGGGTYFIGRGIASMALSVVGTVLTLASTGLLASYFILIMVRRARFRGGLCSECGYAMGAVYTCPECGWTPILDSDYGDRKDGDADP